MLLCVDLIMVVIEKLLYAKMNIDICTKCHGSLLEYFAHYYEDHAQCGANIKARKSPDDES